MAQEMGVLPCLNKSDREITADQIASELGADSLLIGMINWSAQNGVANIMASSYHARADLRWSR